MLTSRRLVAEMMDDPDVDPDDLDDALRFIRRVNRRLGGVRAALRQLRRWSVDWSPGESITLIDLGTGSADIPLAMTDWARAAGFGLHVTAVDAHETTLALAARHVGRRDDIDLVVADARDLMSRFRPGSFDYAHAGMFLHHLPDIEVMTVLRIMHRLSRRGLIVNDLLRGIVGRIGVRLLTLGAPAIVRHDARVSVAAGFTRRDALELARRAGLVNLTFRRHLLHRFTVVSDHGRRSG